MRTVIQRVSQAAVEVDGKTVGEIGPGLVVLLGIKNGDEKADAEYLANKIIKIIFKNSIGSKAKMPNSYHPLIPLIGEPKKIKPNNKKTAIK